MVHKNIFQFYPLFLSWNIFLTKPFHPPRKVFLWFLLGISNIVFAIFLATSARLSKFSLITGFVIKFYRSLPIVWFIILLNVSWVKLQVFRLLFATVAENKRKICNGGNWLQGPSQRVLVLFFLAYTPKFPVLRFHKNPNHMNVLFSKFALFLELQCQKICILRYNLSSFHVPGWVWKIAKKKNDTYQKER